MWRLALRSKNNNFIEIMGGIRMENNIEALKEEIEIEMLWYRQLRKSDIGDSEGRKVIVKQRIEKLKKQYKELTGVDYQ